MSFRTYQPIAEAPKLPPLAPPFQEGWQADRVPQRPANRPIIRDDQLIVPQAVKVIVEGWQPERTKLQSLVKNISYDEQTQLKIPPLAPASKEGWYSERFVLQKLSNTVTRDEQTSGTILSTPPLRSAFPDGWYSERFKPQPLTRNLREEQALTFVNFATPATPLFDGWTAGKPKAYATGKTLVHDEQSASTLLKTPPLSLAFKDGWQTQDMRPAPVRVRLPAGELLLFAVTNSQIVQGWAVEGLHGAMPLQRHGEDATILKTIPLAPTFQEGWQFFDSRPSLPRCSLASAVELLFFASPPPVPPPPVPPPSPYVLVIPATAAQQAAAGLPATVDEDTVEAVRILWMSAGDVTPIPQVDEDTIVAVRFLWENASVYLPALFTLPTQMGRLQSPQALPYAVVKSTLESRKKIGAAGRTGWDDFRTVTITIYGTKVQVVTAAGGVQSVFNNETTLQYPSAANFRRWEPVGDLILMEDEKRKDALDIWKGVLKARVWSVRPV